jgi:hypothetical protein
MPQVWPVGHGIKGSWAAKAFRPGHKALQATRAAKVGDGGGMLRMQTQHQCAAKGALCKVWVAAPHTPRPPPRLNPHASTQKSQGVWFGEGANYASPRYYELGATHGTGWPAAAASALQELLMLQTVALELELTGTGLGHGSLSARGAHNWGDTRRSRARRRPSATG